MGGRGEAVEDEPGRSENVQRFGERRSAIDQQVVAEFELSLIERTGKCRRTAGSEHRGLWIVDKDIAWLGIVGNGGREQSVSFA